MNIHWRILALPLLALPFGPMLMIGDAQTRCPWSVQLQIQQKAAQRYQEKAQRQLAEQMQRQAQIAQMKKVQQAKFTPPVVAQRNVAQPVAPRATPQFQPPAAAIPRVTQKQTQTTNTRLTAGGYVPKGFATTTSSTIQTSTTGVVHSTTGVVRRTTGVGHNTTGVVTSTRTIQTSTRTVQTHTTGVQKSMTQVQKSTTTVMSSTRAPVQSVTGVVKGPTVAPVTSTRAPVVSRTPPTKLMVQDPVKQAQKQSAQKAMNNPLADPRKGKLGDPGSLVVKMDFSCVQCHRKLNLPDSGIAKQPLTLPTGLQKPKPLPAPMAQGKPIDNCAPAPGPNLRQPIAMPRPNLPAPMDRPIVRGFDAPIRMPMLTGMPMARPAPAVNLQQIVGRPIRTPGMDAPWFDGAPAKPKPTIAAATVKPKPAPKEEWKAPALPPLAQGSSANEMVLLSLLESTPTRNRRETPAEESTQEAAARRVTPSINLDGPTLPRLPAHALILDDQPIAETQDAPPLLAQRPVRAPSANTSHDLSRPLLPPLGARVLVP